MAQASARRGSKSWLDGRVLEYLLENGDDLKFTSYFWKRCEADEDEVAQYSRFVKAMIQYSGGNNAKRISQQLHVSRESINKWIRFKRNSKLTDYLRELILLGRPRDGWVWLSINNTPGHAIPKGPFVEVPKVITDWRDVNRVLNQITPLRPFRVDTSRDYRFGFLLGMMIGDAGKKRQE